MKNNLTEPLITPLPRKPNYALFSLIAGACYGVNDFLTSIVVEDNQQFRLVYFSYTGALAYFLVYHLQAAIRQKRTKGTFWSKTESCYFNEQGSLDLSLVWIMFLRNITALVGTLLVYFTIQMATQSAVSPATILSIFASTSMFCAIAFYLIFAERLSKQHVVGMFLIGGAVVLIAQSKSYQDLSSSKQISVFVPVIMAVLTSLWFTLSTVIVRIASKNNIPPLQQCADPYPLGLLLFCPLLVYEHFYVSPFLFSEAVPLLAGSFVSTTGTVLLTLAFSFGLAGPGQALVQLQTPVQLMLEIFIWGQLPSLMGVGGMALGLLGAVLIILA